MFVLRASRNHIPKGCTLLIGGVNDRPQSNAHVPHRFRDFQRAFRMPLPDESLSVSRSSADAEVTVTVGIASEQKEIRSPLWTWPVLVVAVRAPLTSRRCTSKCACKCASIPFIGVSNVTEDIHKMLHSFWQGKLGCLEVYRPLSQCLHYADHVGLLSSISIQNGWRCSPGDFGLLAPSIDRAAATPWSCDTVLAAFGRSAAVSCCPTSATARNTSPLISGDYAHACLSC